MTSIADINREYDKQSLSRTEEFPVWLQSPLVKATYFVYKYSDRGLSCANFVFQTWLL
jgi:hypothetical protein